MLTVGLTGGIGSGKSTIAAQFTALGVNVIDADAVAREVVVPGSAALRAIAGHFGEEIIDREGELRRNVLRELVFDNEKERHWLEALLHPLINRRIQEQLAASRSPYTILMSPLLTETDQKQHVDRILVVDLDPERQMERTLARDPSSRKTVEGIMAAQASRQQRLDLADDIVNNDGEVRQLQNEIQALHEKYLALSKESN